MPQDDNSTDPNTLGIPGSPKRSCNMLETPEYLARWHDLCGTAKGVYSALLHYCGEGYQCQIALDWIAALQGISRESAKKHVATLVKLGLVSRKHQYNQPDIYTLRLSPILQGKYPKKETGKILPTSEERVLSTGYHITPVEEKANSTDEHIPVLAKIEALPPYQKRYFRHKYARELRALEAGVRELDDVEG